MITARSPRRTARNRVSAGLPRVLALAVMLFGVLLAHGVHVEGSGGHLPTGAAAAPGLPGAERGVQGEIALFAVVATDGDDDGHASPNPAEHCASGQTQQGTTAVSPCFAVSVREPVTAVRSGVKPGRAGAELHGASAQAIRAAVVQQV
ncbi:hypothetical protein U5640_36490 [Streptomyces sp. SS7]|uniref:hypothetical protein n=1 Tax=Streptomyces sp. SS7 TaxID=3108485 RepID=UPI0030EE0C75